MKMYRAITRDTRYVEAYSASPQLFKTKKSLKEWFKSMEQSHYDTQKFFEGFKKQDRFPLVMIGIEEVDVK